jgi:predicted nuclease of predicted toxin-antitoxin system
MRILLDESLPRRLRHTFAGHEVVSVAEAGWSGVENGELLRLAATRFDIFVTADQNLQYQQNLSALPIAVAVLAARNNKLESLRAPAAELLSRLDAISPRSFVHCGGFSD